MAKYYRENRYGEKIEVEKWTCGSCEHYDIDNGKCDEFNKYFSKNDECSTRYSMDPSVQNYGW